MNVIIYEALRACTFINVVCHKKDQVSTAIIGLPETGKNSSCWLETLLTVPQNIITKLFRVKQE